jgi:hypothetical protein
MNKRSQGIKGGLGILPCPPIAGVSDCWGQGKLYLANRHLWRAYKLYVNDSRIIQWSLSHYAEIL